MCHGGKPCPRLLQGTARHHGCKLLAIIGRGMHVVDRLERTAALADLAQERVVRTVADEPLFDLARPHRRRPHAAERDRGARDLAGAILDDERRRRYDREVAMAAGELDKAVAMRLRPKWKARRGDDLVGLDRGRHIGDREGAEWNVT